MTNDLTASGLTLLETLSGHKKVIYECVWSPNGRSLASVAADRTIRVWQPKTGKLLQAPMEHDAFIFGVAWSPNGRYLASASFDKGVRVSYAGSGRLVTSLMEHQGPVYSVAWSADGRYLASASDDKTIGIWDSEKKWRAELLKGHTDWVLSVAWSPESPLLASASRDKTIKLWDGELSVELDTLKGHTDIVNCVTWSADGRYIASASDDRTVRVWNPATRRQIIVLEGHKGEVLSVRFSPDGRLLASKSADDTVRLWRCDNWKPVAKIVDPIKSDLCNGLAFHPKERQLATLGDSQGKIRLWQMDYALLLGDDVPEWHTIQCPECGERLTDSMLAHRFERGHKKISCPVCDTIIPFAEDASDQDRVSTTNEQFDVLLCYNDDDKTAVYQVEEQLKQHNIHLWQPQHNQSVVDALTENSSRIHSLAVFVGEHQTPWHNTETANVLRKFITTQNGHIIFVLLPKSPYVSKFPDNFLYVDFRKSDSEPIDKLVKMIRNGEMSLSALANNGHAQQTRIQA